MSRVLVVSYGVAPSPDHHGVAMDSLLRALGTRYEVDALTVRAGDLPHIQNLGPVRMLRVPLEGEGETPPRREDLEAFRRAIHRQLEGSDYDVIHFRDTCGGGAICDSPLVDATLVFEAGDSLLSWQDRDPLDKELQHCLQRADVVFVRSDRAVSDLRRWVPDARVFNISPGVNIDLFDWDQMPMPRVPRLIYSGQVSPGRGLRTLVNALPEILVHRRVVLWIVGPSNQSYVHELKQLAATLGVSDRVEFFGAVEQAELPRILAMESIGIVPGLPLAAVCPFSVLEHAACRKPIIAARDHRIEEILRDGTELMTFTPGDSRELACLITTVLDDEETRHQMASSGYQRVRDLFSASAARRQLLGAYLSIAPPLPLRRGTVSDGVATTLSSPPPSEATVPNLSAAIDTD